MPMRTICKAGRVPLKDLTASGLLLDLANEALDMSRPESGQVDWSLFPQIW